MNTLNAYKSRINTALHDGHYRAPGNVDVKSSRNAPSKLLLRAAPSARYRVDRATRIRKFRRKGVSELLTSKFPCPLFAMGKPSDQSCNLQHEFQTSSSKESRIESCPQRNQVARKQVRGSGQTWKFVRNALPPGVQILFPMQIEGYVVSTTLFKSTSLHSVNL